MIKYFAFLIAIVLFPMESISGQNDVEEFFDKAWDAVRIVKGGNLLPYEEENFERNAKREARNKFDDNLNLDYDGAHFIASVKKYNSRSELVRHISECRVCNPLFRNLTQNTQVQLPAPVNRNYRVQPARFCVTQFGSCPMAVAITIGSPCYCPTVQGPVWGEGR